MHPIQLRGARTHNLRGLDLELRPGELVAVTGPSGAGKSSLVLDTLYSEAQRRFVESFSPYARQFLERLERPPMESLAPVAAGVAVDRRAPMKSSRSTVASMADLEPYLSALFTREARPFCEACQLEAVATAPSEAAARATEAHPGATAIVTYPLPASGTEQFLDVRESLLAAGYGRVLLQGQVRDLDEVAPSEALASGGLLSVVVERVKLAPKDKGRLAGALEVAWTRGAGVASLHLQQEQGLRSVPVKRGLACPGCAQTFELPRAGLFSTQSPVGACKACKGFGRTLGVDWAKVVPDPRKTLKGGAIRPWSGTSTTWEKRMLRAFCAKKGIPLDIPWGDLRPEERQAVLEGEGSYEEGLYPGVRAWFRWMESRTYKMHVRVLLARYRAYDVCADCGGKRLSAESLRFKVGGLDLAAWQALELSDARARLEAMRPSAGQGALAHAELLSRLRYLEEVGLGYLTMERQARTLSGGEAQRVLLTSALGTSLTGTLFVLDEPTVGLHAADIPPLLRAMRRLAEGGNAVVVVEHEPLVIRACDRVVELGPGAGEAGGRLVFDGTPEEAQRRLELATGRALAPCLVPEAPVIDATKKSKLRIVGARANNLADVTVELPLGCVVAVAGPSGSGKSTLVEDVLYRALARARGYKDVEAPGEHRRIEGATSLKSVSLVDQSPLGRTSRGNCATYSGAWDRVRALFGGLPEAQEHELGPGHFSFNVAAGRCEACAGEGFETVEMQFLADVRLTCPSCQGKRFTDLVLGVKLRGLSVADILELTLDQAAEFFAREAAIQRALGPARLLGLGYLKMGQPLPTLSGGEAQRLKLARALSERTKDALFVLDEPSAGLHADEVRVLNAALRTLAQSGASVVVVDHDLDVIAASDWVLELGPEAGRGGGQLVAATTPRQLASLATRTGLALAERWSSAPEGASSRGAGSAGKASSLSSRDGAPLRAASTPARLPPFLEVEHAREHNLADVSTRLPLGKLVVFTGPSGSGKSTLAFDVIFAEGQRRFLETLSPYARQFLPTLPRPDVDRVACVPPSIALEQRTSRSGANSTVATVTEVAHYLRLLYAKVGEARCPACDLPIAARSADAIFRELQGRKANELLLAPVVAARKGTHLDVFAQAAREGWMEARVDGELCSTDKPPKLDKRREHSIDLVIYQGKLGKLERQVFDRALQLGKGVVRVQGPKGELLFSTSRTCPRCSCAVPELDPRWFSFNTKQGRCDACEGTGIEGGPEALAEAGAQEVCSSCEGSRLAPVPRAVRLGGKRYHELCGLPVEEALPWLRALRFEPSVLLIAEAPHRELVRRLAFVEEVGLGYLGLDRRATTLSGGEMQRLRLSAQLGSGLTGALYVLDEPTIGLHPRDTQRLLRNLRSLADTGSTILMVEHDADAIRAADYLVDLGPSGGRRGGRILAQGEPSAVLAHPESPTGKALATEGTLASLRAKLGPAQEQLELGAVRANNLDLKKLALPLGRMIVVAGVSGSGKSTLVKKVLEPALRAHFGLETSLEVSAELRVPASLKRVVAVDQAPIGRTPRSVPATFLGLWDEVRRLYAASPEAQVRGFSPARFSFNTGAGGRCPACEGQGVISHEMAFLPDVTTPCEACHGARFEPSTLEVRYLGLSIGELLQLTADEAAAAFAVHPKIAAPLQVMSDLGIGYLKLGQGSHTLSGGEAQRLKLAAELTSSTRPKPTLYVLDEPTTGLHLGDVARLIGVLDRLVAKGHTLVVVEHHPALMAVADQVVELGPEGGSRGGRLVAQGRPEEVARAKTPTGEVLRAFLGSGTP